ERNLQVPFQRSSRGSTRQGAKYFTRYALRALVYPNGATLVIQCNANNLEWCGISNKGSICQIRKNFTINEHFFRNK
ncbi:MAG: hypothetical protein KDD53_00935, partial [Bdellovibrionales bacterium]|nr:hypothetical protein [Bdellovibrionales bacterium]